MARETVLSRRSATHGDLGVNCSPASMATMKRQVYAALQQPLPDALAEADLLMLQSFTAPDSTRASPASSRDRRAALRRAVRVRNNERRRTERHSTVAPGARAPARMRSRIDDPFAGRVRRGDESKETA